MDRDYKKELSNFEAVWRRVSGAKQGKSSGGAKLMPRKEAKSRANRFAPPK